VRFVRSWGEHGGRTAKLCLTHSHGSAMLLYSRSTGWIYTMEIYIDGRGLFGPLQLVSRDQARRIAARMISVMGGKR